MVIARSGPSKTSVISSLSKVARPRVYRNLSKLENLGLVERIIENPIKYRGIPFEKGLLLLLETKTEQFKEIRAETRALLHVPNADEKNNRKEFPHFVLIPKGRTVIDRINTAIEKTQQSMDLVLSWKRFSRGIASTLAESMENAWARNVKVRFILEQPSENKTAKQLIQYCRENPCCQIRFIHNHPETVFGIYDKKQLFLIVFSKTDLPSSPALYSTNHSLIALAKDYFELLWNETTESLH